MSDRHASGHTPDYDAYGFAPYSTGTHQTVGTAFADDTTGAYVSLPYIPQQYASGTAYGSSSSYGDDTGGWPVQDPYAAYAQPQQAHTPPQQSTPSYDEQPYAGPSHSGQSYNSQSYSGQSYDHTSYGYSSYGDSSYENTSYGHSSYEHTSHQYTSYQHTSYDPTTGYDTGTYTTAAPQPQPEWDSGAYPVYGYGYAGGYGYGYDANGDTGLYEQIPAYDTAPAEPQPAAGAPEVGDDLAAAQEAEFGASADALAEEWDDDEPAVRHDYVRDGLADGAPVARSRRRKPAKRSALLTVAVPSVAVMGVAAVGAAAVTGVGMAQDSAHTQADGAPGNAPTQQLDRQLAGISRDADDFAARANRSQERVDLKERQAAAKRAAEAEAARKEALRPKFVLPVKQKGLSAYFGQAGEHWMTIHTGIDFPVQPGTPVMAATDGTVRTQWNPSYGNMAIVTAPDGTETWYCHLSSTKIRSGKVKAGTVIAYSGNTGNTTGPHLHFEVRPHGGAPVDPLPWLLAHGLDPR